MEKEPIGRWALVRHTLASVLPKGKLHEKEKDLRFVLVSKRYMYVGIKESLMLMISYVSLVVV